MRNFCSASEKTLETFFLALQIGQISGGFSRAQRYPQTLHRQTGRGKLERFAEAIFTTFLFSGGGRRSGIDDIPVSLGDRLGYI